MKEKRVESYMSRNRWSNYIDVLWKEHIAPVRKHLTWRPKKRYLAFIGIVTVVSILAAETSSYGKLKMWYYNLTNQELVNKGIAYTQENGSEFEMPGQFLTYYRYTTFSQSDPNNVDTAAPMVAFTFDDGPNPTYTQRILDVLNANYSHATFFVVGNNAEQYPEVLQSIIASGSEIGNHTYHHKNLTKEDADSVEQEVSGVNRAVKSATGEKATLIRPPYGAYNEDVLAQLTEPVVLWDLDTEDWESRNAKVIADKVISSVKDGDIVLMHDIYDSTAEAVELMVPKLKEMGFQIVSVSQMAQYKGRTLELGKAYGEIDGLSGQ